MRRVTALFAFVAQVWPRWRRGRRNGSVHHPRGHAPSPATDRPVFESCSKSERPPSLSWLSAGALQVTFSRQRTLPAFILQSSAPNKRVIYHRLITAEKVLELVRENAGPRQPIHRYFDLA